MPRPFTFFTRAFFKRNLRGSRRSNGDNLNSGAIPESILNIGGEKSEANLGPLESIQIAQNSYRLSKGPALMMPSVVAHGISDILGIIELEPPEYFLDVRFMSEPVYHGNHIKPHKCQNVPFVHFETKSSNADKYYCLVMFDPDGCLFDAEKSIIHYISFNMKPWLKGDKYIVSNSSGNGKTLCKYLPPIPFQGTGDHRIIFAVFEQPHQYDINKVSSRSIFTRTFDLSKFLSKFQNLKLHTYSFFQTSWDQTVTSTCINVLKMEEPIFALEENFSPSQSRRKDITSHIMDKYRTIKISKR